MTSRNVSILAAVVSVLGAAASISPVASRVLRDRARAGDPAPRAVKVLCVGDSLTANGYPEDLQAELGPGFHVVNGGVSGDLTRDMLARWKLGLHAGGYQVVVVLGGSNDLIAASHEASVPTSNLRALYELAEARGARVVRVSVPPFKGNAWTQSREAARVELNRAICSASCADAAGALDDGAGRLRPRFDRGDHLHLSVEGMRELARVIAPAVRAAGG